MELRTRNKKAGKHDVVMEHFARTDDPHTRRQDFGIQFRQQIHNIENRFDKLNLSKFLQYMML